jgi:hypothetical protein
VFVNLLSLDLFPEEVRVTWWKQLKSAFYLVFLWRTMKFFGSIDGALVELHRRENRGMDAVRFTYGLPGNIALFAGRKLRLRAFELLTTKRDGPSVNFTVRDLKLAFATTLTAGEFHRVHAGIVWLLQMDEGCAWTELGLAMRAIANTMGKDDRWKDTILDTDERDALHDPQAEVRLAAISLALSRIGKEIWADVATMVSDVDRPVRMAALHYLQAAFKLEEPASPRYDWGRQFVNALTLAAMDERDHELAVLARRVLAEAEVRWDETSDNLFIVLIRARVFGQNYNQSLLFPLVDIDEERIIMLICKDPLLRDHALKKIRLESPSESGRWRRMMEAALQRLEAERSAASAGREGASASS